MVLCIFFAEVEMDGRFCIFLLAFRRLHAVRFDFTWRIDNRFLQISAAYGMVR